MGGCFCGTLGFASCPYGLALGGPHPSHAFFFFGPIGPSWLTRHFHHHSWLAPQAYGAKQQWASECDPLSTASWPFRECGPRPRYLAQNGVQLARSPRSHWIIHPSARFPSACQPPHVGQTLLTRGLPWTTGLCRRHWGSALCAHTWAQPKWRVAMSHLPLMGSHCSVSGIWTCHYKLDCINNVLHTAAAVWLLRWRPHRLHSERGPFSLQFVSTARYCYWNVPLTWPVGGRNEAVCQWLLLLTLLSTLV